MRLSTLELNNQLKVTPQWITPISCGVKVSAPFYNHLSLLISTNLTEIEKYDESHANELNSPLCSHEEEKICGCDYLFSLQPNTTYHIRVVYTPNEQGKPIKQWQKGEILTITTPSNDFWGNEIVDMGNNQLWRNRNVGADNPTECGTYYLWGATTTVKYDANSFSYFPNVPTIYLENISGTEYDAATKNLGEDWQMPTYSDVYNLLNSCTITKIWADRIIYDFKSKINDSHLYIPASAYSAFIIGNANNIKSSADLDDKNDVYLPFFWIGNMADEGDYRNCLKGDRISISKRYYELPIRPKYVGE